MKDIAQKFANVFGLCVITVSLCSGCATGAPSKQAANLYDLNYFQPDCRIKAEQIAYLQSLRRSPDDMLFSISGWLGYDKQLNWTLNHHLNYLSQYC